MESTYNFPLTPNLFEDEEHTIENLKYLLN